MLSLYLSLKDFEKNINCELEEYANTVSKIEDMIRELILGIDHGDYDNDKIVEELEDIKAILY